MSHLLIFILFPQNNGSVTPIIHRLQPILLEQCDSMSNFSDNYFRLPNSIARCSFRAPKSRFPTGPNEATFDELAGHCEKNRGGSTSAKMEDQILAVHHLRKQGINPRSMQPNT